MPQKHDHSDDHTLYLILLHHNLTLVVLSRLYQMLPVLCDPSLGNVCVRRGRTASQDGDHFLEKEQVLVVDPVPSFCSEMNGRRHARHAVIIIISSGMPQCHAVYPLRYVCDVKLLRWLTRLQQPSRP